MMTWQEKSFLLENHTLYAKHDTLNYTRRTKSWPVGKIIPKSQKSFKWANSNLDKVTFSVKKATQPAKSIQIDKTIPNCKNHSRSRNFIQWTKPCIKSGKKKLIEKNKQCSQMAILIVIIFCYIDHAFSHWLWQRAILRCLMTRR